MTGNGLAKVKITKQTQFVNSSGPAWLSAGFCSEKNAKNHLGRWGDPTPIPLSPARGTRRLKQRFTGLVLTRPWAFIESCM